MNCEVLPHHLHFFCYKLSFPTLKCIKIQLFHGELGDCNSEKVMLCYSQPGLRPPEINLNLSPYLARQLFDIYGNAETFNPAPTT